MSHRSISTFLLVIAVGGGWFAGRLMSADPPKAKTSETDLAKIEQQIASASLKLAENELQVLVDANRTLPNTFPRSAVERAQQVVALAKERLEHAGKNEAADAHANYIGLTEAEWKGADTQYRAALAAVSKVRDAVPRLELERLRLNAELAKLRLDRAQHAQNVPEVALIGWQLEDIREQVRRVARQVELYRGNE